MDRHPGRVILRCAAAGVAVVLAIAVASPASAHALLASASPGAGSNLVTPPTEVTLTFTEVPDPSLSSIKILSSSGVSVTSGRTVAVPGSPARLRVPLATLASGVYTVAWVTVSTVDGHVARGSYAFGVGATPPSSGAQSETSGSSTLSPLEVAGRWLLYAGLLLLLGVGFVGVAVFTTPPAVARRIATFAWLAATLGTLAVVAAQMSNAGVGLTDLRGTSLGGGLALRAAPLIVAAGPLAWMLRERAPSRVALAVVGLAGGLAMLADVTLGHAAASGAVLFNVVVQWVHVAAAGTWLGGLPVLLLGLRDRPSDETRRLARRFATFATFGIGLVAATGVVRALSELGPLQNLAFTDFGRLLVVKSGLLGLLAALGAINHFRSVPNAGRSLGLLRRIGSLELTVAVTVLVFSATLVNLAPPAQASTQATPKPESVTVAGNDFGTTLRVQLTATPGTTGFNTFRALLTDYDTGKPLSDRTVTLRFTLPARPDVGASQLRLEKAGAGLYQATGANLSLDGSWRISALVEGQAGSVDVALPVATRQPQLAVDINPVPGLPTIYTVHLAQQRTVQVYLDPGKPGANEVHLTFFDSAGKELPVPSAQIGIGAAGEPMRQPVARTLEPGHFVADATLSAATYNVSFSGIAPDGQSLTAQLQIPVSK